MWKDVPKVKKSIRRVEISFSQKVRKKVEISACAEKRVLFGVYRVENKKSQRKYDHLPKSHSHKCRDIASRFLAKEGFAYDNGILLIVLSIKEYKKYINTDRYY